VITVLQWSPLLVGLAAPLLVGLLVAGRGDVRRTAVLVALAAAFTLLVAAPLSVVDLQFLLHGPPGNTPTLDVAVHAAHDLFAALTGVLALAAWTLLLAAAVIAGDRGRLIVLGAVFALVMVLQAALYYGVPVQVITLETTLRSTTGGQLLYSLISHLASAAALVCTFLLPPEAAAEVPGA
jgi:hypothetical protein